MEKILFPVLTEEDKKLPFYVKSIGIRKNQERITRPEGYPDFHWLHCSKGKGMLIIQGKEYFLGPDSGFFAYPVIPHEYYAVEEPWETHWMTFNGSSVLSVLELLALEPWMIFQLRNRLGLERIMDAIYVTGKSSDIMKTMECSEQLYRFLVQLRHYIFRHDQTRTKSSGLNYLQAVFIYIEKNFASQITLEDMAFTIGVTPQHLCRLFKQFLGIRPFDYLTRYRLQVAKEILIGADTPVIKEVAKTVGYNDSSYFCAIFKEYEGVTPTEFRNQYRSR
jgi:AraC family transcriptional regulator, arabinose operon regulatory protein